MRWEVPKHSGRMSPITWSEVLASHLLHTLAFDPGRADCLRLFAVRAGLHIIQGGRPVVHLHVIHQ